MSPAALEPACAADHLRHERARAERLYRQQRHDEALHIGEALLAQEGLSDDERAPLHYLVAQCLHALGQLRRAAHHHALAAEQAVAELLPAGR